MGCPEVLPFRPDEAYDALQREMDQHLTLSHHLSQALEQADKTAYYAAVAQALGENLRNTNADCDFVRNELYRLKRGIKAMVSESMAFNDSCQEDKVSPSLVSLNTFVSALVDNATVVLEGGEPS